MSKASLSEPVHPDLLEPYCETVAFAAGDILRVKGQHYDNLYLIAEGKVGVRLGDAGDASGAIELGSGATIGEIGFIRGSPAVAHVVASEDSRAVVIDDRTIRRIKTKDADLAVLLSRFLASTTEHRMKFNSAVLDDRLVFGKDADIEVLLCRDDAMLARAMRLRYEVYCGELGRESPYADHDKKTIRDNLDGFGHTFIVLAGGESVGTIRANLSREGDLGILEALYGMDVSAHHPGKTSVCTKFIVKRSHRGGAVAMKLLAAVTSYLLRQDMKECYIDCIPALLHYYRSFGFKNAGEMFLHYENGPSYPMKLLPRQARKLCGELGRLQSVQIYLKAQMYRWLDRKRIAGVGS